MKKFPIFNLVFPSNYLMTSSLLRFQEHYESPKFRGKLFTFEQFMDWYAATRGGIFSYFEDWGGFNFPGHILYSQFDPQDDYGTKESVIRRVVDAEVEKRDYPLFYVIGTTEKGNALAHEMAHALFYLHPKYAADVKRLCVTHAKKLKPFAKWFTETGYHPKVWIDETNAYLLTGIPDELKKKNFPKQEFAQLFKDHLGFDVGELSNPVWTKKHSHYIDMEPKLKRLRY